MEARMKPRTARTKVLPAPTKTLPAVLAAAAVALLLLLPGARAAGNTVVWAAPTHPDQFHFAATSGKELVFKLTASTSKKGAKIVIEPVGGLPAGAWVGSSSNGGKATATFRWRPEEPGDYTLGFVARTGGASAPVRTYLIRVSPTYPYAYPLTDAKIAHWAPLVRDAVVRSAPRPSAKVVTKLGMNTNDLETRQIVLVLDGLDKTRGDTWYHVRLPILPNNSTGWVKARDLGDLYAVDTHLYIDRGKLTATLKRNGKTVFTTRVGVGKATTPTPRGQFYIRGKLTHFGNPFYGPIVFGTSARSTSNAPEMRVYGEGFVGVHGTSLPWLIPGRPSHGCVRMKNEAIVQLAKLMRVGTPVTIT
jgi:hypothetical protein